MPDLVAHVSIRRAPMPRPGVRPRPWAWEDVLEAPPPRSAPDEAAFVVRHGFDDTPDAEARLGYATVVRVPSGGSVVVDEQVLVEPRLLSPVLRAERMVTTRLERGGRAGARFVESGSSRMARYVPGRGGRVVRSGGGILAGAMDWASSTLVEGLRSIAEAPDRIATGRESMGAHLGHRRSRRAFLRGLLDPYSLTAEGKAAAIFLVGASLALAALVVTLSVFFARPALVEEWRAMLLFFMLGIGSTLLFPFFPETRLNEVAAVLAPAGSPHLGGVLAILTITVAMTVGAWLVLFLGDAIHGTLRKGVRPGSRLARILGRAEGFAARRGFWAAFLVLSVPLGPDTPVFYVLASVRTPPRAFLLGTFLGLLVRFSLWYFVPIGVDNLGKWK